MYLIIDNMTGGVVGIAHNMFELRESAARVIAVETERLMRARYNIQYIPLTGDKHENLGSMKEVLNHGNI